MRSFFLVGGLACLAGIIFVKGYLLRPVGAASSSEMGTEIRFEYTAYDDEAPPALPTRPAEQPEITVVPQPDEPASRPPVDTESPSESPQHEQDLPALDSAPHADAGPDRTVWIGDSEITLDGTGSRGTELRYFWRQRSGPVDLLIDDPRAALTVAAGLAQEWPERDAAYEFELTVRDAQGREAVDAVRFTAQAAPAITIIPAARRRLAWREGYLLGHFESWKTNHTDDVEVFVIRCPSELTFHHLGETADYDIAPLECNTGFEYQLTLFYREPESSTFVEFFVDTPERIPAILQFGVNWD